VAAFVTGLLQVAASVTGGCHVLRLLTDVQTSDGCTSTVTGNRFIENGRKDIWARVAEEHARDAERYIL
jgi:hypothetical protein